MVQKILGAQRDFSYGEVDAVLKRADDHPARKAGLRQMVNARILNSGSVQDRPGRRALYPTSNNAVRTERVSLVAGVKIDLQFSSSRLKVISSDGILLANFTAQGNGAALPWLSADDIARIVVAPSSDLKIYICFGNAMRPQVVSFDGVSTYTISDYAELVGSSGQKKTAFYRISPQGVTAQPSGTSGAITVRFSSPIVVAGMVGTRIRFCERQILLGSVIDNSNMNATVIEALPSGQQVNVTGSIGNLALGDVLIGATSGASGIVTSAGNTQTMSVFPDATSFSIGFAVTGGTSGATGVVTSVDYIGQILTVALSSGTTFVNGETITGPGGSATVSSASSTLVFVQLIPNGGAANAFVGAEKVAGPSFSATVSGVVTQPPQAVTLWDEEVMNAFRGYPASCFVDQYRLGFCNFSVVPGAILWSAINSPNDLFASDASTSSNAIFEIAPNKVQVYFVVPGPEGSEFILCDRRVYYIPISATNPLKPGSVAFQTLSADGAAQIQPRLAQEAIVYVNAGQNSMMAIIATGAYLRPFNTKNLSEYHAHLFNGITAIACPSADGTFNERYTYVMNADGSIVVGKYDALSLATDDNPRIGWGPWNGSGSTSWVSAFAADVIFTSTYFAAGLVEILDDTQYLDCAFTVNSPPAAFAPPAGMGPLWFFAAKTVSLMDQGTRNMGIYSVDGNGNIIPQNNGGEDLSSASLVAGQPWVMTVEPFCPDANPGQDVGQRMFKRRVARFAAYVIHSTGFVMARLFSGPTTPTSPPLGTVMNFTRFPTWNLGDDQTLPPPQREIAERTRPLGRSFDPRVAVIKDVPGPLQIVELGMEATI